MRSVSAVVGAAVAFGLWGLQALAQPTGVTGYEVIEIPPLPGHSSTWPAGLDNLGRFLALSNTTPGERIVWINGETFVVPSVPGYGVFQCNDIGSGGVVVGRASPLQGLSHRAVAWTASGEIRLLDLIPGTDANTARSVDDRPWPNSRIAGDCGITINYATTWRGTSPTQVGGARSGANAINNFGHAVGAARNQEGVSRPTLWRDGQTIDVGGEPLDQSGSATAVNDWTEVVGNLSNIRRPFRWFNGYTALLPKLHSCNAIGEAWAVNSAGLIAGQDGDAPCESLHAMIWERLTSRAQVPPEYAVFDLSNYIPRHPDVELLDAKDINDAGQMAVFGEYDDGRERGFLVTPYLFEMSDPVPGRAGVQNAITVTGLQPNQRVLLAYGTREGAHKIHPSCPGGTLLIRDPQTSPIVRANANGLATITVNVPQAARGRTIRMQAIAPFECEISHTVTWTFE